MENNYPPEKEGIIVDREKLLTSIADLVLFFKTGSLYAVLAGLELTEIRLPFSRVPLHIWLTEIHS